MLSFDFTQLLTGALVGFVTVILYVVLYKKFSSKSKGKKRK
ncbi:MAG: hypothetical protein Q3988_06320 [Gemella sp.]|nr:hypothetical protein [Gemella sp.]